MRVNILPILFSSLFHLHTQSEQKVRRQSALADARGESSNISQSSPSARAVVFSSSSHSDSTASKIFCGISREFRGGSMIFSMRQVEQV